MQAIRKMYSEAPSAIPIPEALQRKPLEVILLVQEEDYPSPKSLKALLAAIPEVGEDADFARQRDGGRGDMEWDF